MQPGFRDALRYWFILGCTSFGGPAGQIAMMHAELVGRRRWLSEGRFLHALNYCMVLPGPEAQQLATYIGWLMHRTWGGIIAGVLFVMPSLLLLIALSWVYMTFGNQSLVAAVFAGIKPAVTAIVLQAAWRLGSRTLRNPLLWALALASFVAIFVFKLPFPLIVCGAALAGYLGGRFVPGAFKMSGGHGASVRSAGPALIDDDTPTPAHARFSRSRLLRVLAFGLLLWLVPLGLLILAFGWQGTLSQMAWFFTKAALLTFGGAYAVLPYVNQGAVEHFGWLSAAQMMDGLALGETTPGPLIMVVAFVAYVGGHAAALFGPDLQFVAGAAAAVVVTWFTFLPSFIFILAGGPLVESTRDSLRLTAPLSAISAAVVGVIVSLALHFGMHVLWPEGLSARIDFLAAGTMLLATIALLRFQIGVVPVLAGCGVLGLLGRFIL